MPSSNKDFGDMTLDELRVERAYWDEKIVNAPRWGAALAAAAEFRDACDAWIKQRAAE